MGRIIPYTMENKKWLKPPTSKPFQISICESHVYTSFGIALGWCTMTPMGHGWSWLWDGHGMLRKIVHPTRALLPRLEYEMLGGSLRSIRLVTWSSSAGALLLEMADDQSPQKQNRDFTSAKNMRIELQGDDCDVCDDWTSQYWSNNSCDDNLW